MTFSLEITTEANLEIVEAYVYYEEKQAGLGERFLKQLDKYFIKILQTPKHYAVKRKPYREAFIRKFPFLIIYEVTEEKIIVYSVFNTSRNPTKKPE